MLPVIVLVVNIILILFLVWLSWKLATLLAASLGANGRWVMIAYYACALIIVVLIIAGQISIPLHIINF